MPKFGTKMSCLSIFGLEYESNIVIFDIQHTRICLIAKFSEKMKMPNVGTKNTLFGYF